MKGNFLNLVVMETKRRGVLVNQVLAKMEGQVGDVKAGGNLGCSNHEVVEFRNLYGRNRAINRISTS